MKKYKKPRKAKKDTSWHCVYNEVLHFKRKNILLGASLEKKKLDWHFQKPILITAFPLRLGLKKTMKSQ